MGDFQFLYNKIADLWTVLAPRRAKRPHESREQIPVCPFCVGKEYLERELYRITAGGIEGVTASSPTSLEQQDQNWLVRVLPNKFPFAPIHELIIHSPDHHKNFGELPIDQASLIFQAYRARYNEHRDKGQVYIFHNRGEQAGESLPHPHTQLTVIDRTVKMQIPPLDQIELGESVQTQFFSIFCPLTSQWPDEVWVAPLRLHEQFGDASDDELTDLATIMTSLVQIMDLRHGHEFPFNFYIYPGRNWYLRFIPRQKVIGGFEVGTGIFVNTQDPRETFAFVREHLLHPDVEKIKREHQAEYGKHV